MIYLMADGKVVAEMEARLFSEFVSVVEKIIGGNVTVSGDTEEFDKVVSLYFAAKGRKQP